MPCRSSQRKLCVGSPGGGGGGNDKNADARNARFVATTFEITTIIEIIMSIVVENEFQTKHHIATTFEITTTIEIIISIVVENAFKTKQSVAHY